MRIGILSFYPAFQPPRSGGELRLSHLAAEVSKLGAVEMVAPTYPDKPFEEVRHNENWVERRHPKGAGYVWWHRVLDRFAGFPECSALVCSLACAGHESLAKDADEVRRRADILIHEHGFLAPVAPSRGRPDQLFVLDAHNLEAALAVDMFGKGPWGRWAAARIRRLEGMLAREADVILACSDEEADAFARFYRLDRSKFFLAPNGVDTRRVHPPLSGEEREERRARLGLSPADVGAVFIGSKHPPNVESVEFLARRVAPELPGVRFFIAGKVCEAFAAGSTPPNMRLLGLVDEETKDDLLRGCDVALNPMFSGAGTNLKMFDYFASGLAVLTTPVGARGIDLARGRDAVVASGGEFAAALRALAEDPARRARLSAAGRDLACARYDWAAIGESLRDLYRHKTARKVLVLNDYPVQPADAGGRIRIDAVERALAAAGVPVTTLTLSTEESARRAFPGPRREEVNIPRSLRHRSLDRFLSESFGLGADDCSALVATRLLTPEYTAALRRELPRAAVVLYSHPYLAGMRPLAPAGTAQAYDAHNIEWELKERLFGAKGWIGRLLVRRVRKAEAALARECAATYCVSGETLDRLKQLAGAPPREAHVAPNGVDCAAKDPVPHAERPARRAEAGLGPEPLAIFLGSGHPPNAEAARAIVERIAPAMPEATFLIVGSVNGWFWGQPLPENVVMTGAVAGPVKDRLLALADLALNPMRTGSGTSLKLFDYLASGLPVLSTEIGARGLRDDEFGAVALAAEEDFPARMADLLADRTRLAAMSQEGIRTARERYDWNVALAPMVESLKRLGGFDG
ncbi:MAG: glycosyltransferase family 4 protein [Candidatus Sumerlaeia bacterium]|nr:glycosyltransferase family 4 protein [Candidatus Sumerlaeia bacterium]